MAGAPRSDFARRRRAARLAAVQALYQMEMAGAGAKAVVREYLDHRIGLELDGVRLDEADPDYFRAIVEGVVEEQALIDSAIAARLAPGWKLARIDSIVRAILRAGVWELLRRRDTAAPVVIDEHVELARDFFDGPEPGLVNAILDRVAKETGAAAP